MTWWSPSDARNYRQALPCISYCSLAVNRVVFAKGFLGTHPALFFVEYIAVVFTEVNISVHHMGVGGCVGDIGTNAYQGIWQKYCQWNY